MTLAEIYTQRREKLTKILDGETAVFTAFSAMQQTNDSSAPFVQDASFFYLTGITEPDWRLLLSGEDMALVAPAKSEIHRIFDGGLSAEEAKKISGIAEVISSDTYIARLEEISKAHQTVHTVFDHPHSKDFDFTLNPAAKILIKQLKKYFSDVKDCRQTIATLKAIKSPEEVELIQRAIDISIDGFKAVHEKLPTTEFEYQVEALLSYEFRFAGSQGHAYQPIVGVGKNACTLHYIENNDPLSNGGLVLIDAGAKVSGYAADITRTYAVGETTQREKDVHNEVERAHKAIIDLIKPGYGLKEYHDAVDVIMKQALKNLGLLNVPEDYRRYFPHAVSHGLGIDVHDSLGGFVVFEPGMVLTVEPGIYIPEEGIGVRIEDDILVTEAGNRNLSAALPTSL